MIGAQVGQITAFEAEILLFFSALFSLQSLVARFHPPGWPEGHVGFNSWLAMIHSSNAINGT
jgi:hypothetical protein